MNNESIELKNVDNKINKKNVLFVVLATILVWFPFDLILDATYSLYTFFGIKIIGMFIYYMLLEKKHVKLVNLYIIIGYISAITCMYCFNSGVVAGAESLVKGFLYDISLYISVGVFYLVAVIYFVLCCKNFIFRKKS